MLLGGGNWDSWGFGCRNAAPSWCFRGCSSHWTLQFLIALGVAWLVARRTRLRTGGGLRLGGRGTILLVRRILLLLSNCTRAVGEFGERGVCKLRRDLGASSRPLLGSLLRQWIFLRLSYFCKW